MLVADSVFLVLASVPTFLIFLAWSRWATNIAPSVWRRWVALAALLCGSAGAMAPPILFVILVLIERLHPLGQLAIRSLDDTIVDGFLVSAIGLIPALLAWGRTRRLTVSSCVVSLIVCYLAAQAMSY
jgi:hypothetical protein